MKILYCFFLFCIVFSIVSCTVESRLRRGKYNARIAQITRELKQMYEKDSVSAIEDQTIKITKDGKTTFFVPTKMFDDENMMHLELAAVTVTAKSRTLSERMGKVNIDFVITLPKELQGNCQSVVVTPYLHKNGEDIPLQELTIRGGLFSKVQDRNYWQFEKYKSLFRPDAIAEQRAFERFVPHPYPKGVRLDSIVENRNTLAYYYTQEVKTDRISKRMQITLRGKVVALDHSYYELPMSDTLHYTISSMLSFVDTTKRYVTEIIEKYAMVKDRNYLTFKVNDTRIIDTLGDNAKQLEKIETLMNTLVNQYEFHVDSIVLTASASPEGSFRKNDQLAKGRALSLRDHLVKKFPGSGVDTLITVRWIGEDWAELVKLIERSDAMMHKQEVLKLIAEKVDRDTVEKEIERQYPDDYKYMFDNLYPLLRSVSFKYDLRRVGMIKDTIHTTVPDAEYQRGVDLLNEREYAQALYILDKYKDRNTVIALLSLGYDQSAYEILNTLPKTAITEYLKAIACARLSRKTEGMEHYNEACEMDENLQYRGALDPEITLLKELKDEKGN